jgi:tRNA G18 (ribose-2'-O)-methylase SpoU
MDPQVDQVTSNKPQVPPPPVTSLADPRIQPFLDLTQPEKRSSPTHFVAEGEKVTIRLLQSVYRCEAVLCAEHKVDNIRPLLQPGTELLVAPRRLVQEIAGFKFHSGVIGLGVRRAPRDFVGATPVSPVAQAPGTRASEAGLAPTSVIHSGPILVLPEITDPANLGALIRVGAAFGVRTVVLGEHCRDPFTRQTVRTSMGTIFTIDLIQSRDLRSDLRAMQRAGIELLATVLDHDAEPLATFTPTAAFALLVGNEGPGLDHDVIDMCDRRLTIPMRLGTDSLNVVVATGIFLHHLCPAE